MSFFKKLIKGAGKIAGGALKIGAGALGVEVGTNKPQVIYLEGQKTGFDSGRGTLENPLQIPEVSIKAPAKANTIEVMSNIMDIAKQPPLAQKINEFLKTSTKDVGVEAGLDIKTKWFLGAGVGVLALALIIRNQN